MNTRPILIVGLALGLSQFLISFSLAADPVFKAGAAQRDVTPLEPVPLWGYGDRHDTLSNGTLDPLMAAAIVIQAGDQKMAIVGLDLGRSPNEKSLQTIRERIKAEAGIEHSFIAGSHTHHAPVLELSDEPGKGKGRFDAALRYYKKLEDDIVAAIVEANSKLVPAKIATGAIDLQGYNRNRHTKLLPKPVDTQLGIMRLDDMEGKPIAVMVNFAAHPTSIPSETIKFSADFAGSLKNQVMQEFGGQAVFMQGACGDLSTDRGGKDYVEFGKAIGDAAVKLAKTLEPKVPEKPTLEVREKRFKYESRTNLNNPAIRVVYSIAFFPELISNFVDEYADGVRPRLTVALLNGEIAFVGGSGEFFCEHPIRLRERARVKQLFFLGYNNGYHQYFPTIEAASEGGYGADSQVAPVAVGAGEEIMNTALLWLYQMRGKL